MTFGILMEIIDGINVSVFHRKKLLPVAAFIATETEVVMLVVSRSNRPRSERNFRYVVGKLGGHARKYILQTAYIGDVAELYASLPWTIGHAKRRPWKWSFFKKYRQVFANRPILKLLDAINKTNWECHLIVFAYIKRNEKCTLCPNNQLRHMVSLLQWPSCSWKVDQGEFQSRPGVSLRSPKQHQDARLRNKHGEVLGQKLLVSVALRSNQTQL